MNITAVTGRLVVEEWTSEEGEPRSRAHVVARAVDFLDRRPSAEESDGAPTGEEYGDYDADQEPY